MADLDLTPSHYFQSQDRVHVASSYLQSVFERDPVLARHPEFRRLMDVAVDHLEQLYQALGQHDQSVPDTPEHGGWRSIDSQQDLHALDDCVDWDDSDLIEIRAGRSLWPETGAVIHRRGVEALDYLLSIRASCEQVRELELALVECDAFQATLLHSGLAGRVTALMHVELGGGPDSIRCSRIFYRWLPVRSGS